MRMGSAEARKSGEETRPGRNAPLKPKNGLSGPLARGISIDCRATGHLWAYNSGARGRRDRYAVLVFVDESYDDGGAVRAKSTFAALAIQERRYREFDMK